MDLLAIDPGDATGWAHFKGYQLTSCGLLTSDSYSVLPVCQNVIVEEPQVYRFGQADPNRLLILSEKVGRILQLFPHANKVKPRVWKGQMPKEICHARFLPKLGPLERVVLADSLEGVAKGLRHNVKDAVCMGLWRLRR